MNKFVEIKNEADMNPAMLDALMKMDKQIVEKFRHLLADFIGDIDTQEDMINLLFNLSITLNGIIFSLICLNHAGSNLEEDLRILLKEMTAVVFTHVVRSLSKAKDLTETH